MRSGPWRLLFCFDRSEKVSPRGNFIAVTWVSQGSKPGKHLEKSIPGRGHSQCKGPEAGEFKEQQVPGESDKRKNGRGWGGGLTAHGKDLRLYCACDRKISRVPSGTFALPKCKFHESTVLTAPGAPV